MHSDDGQPSLRPHEAASISTLGLVGQATLQGSPTIQSYSSFEAFRARVGGAATLDGKLFEIALQWSADGPSASERALRRLAQSMPQWSPQEALDRGFARILEEPNKDTLSVVGRIATTHWAVRGFFENGGARLVLVDVDAKQKAEFLAGGRLNELSLPQYDVGLLAVPGDLTPETRDAVRMHCARRDVRDPEGETFCFGILDAALPMVGPAEARDAAPACAEHPDGSSVASYWPWLEVGKDVVGAPIVVPPSGHVAGIYARFDGAPWPHRAPAGDDATVRGVRGLSVDFNDVDAGWLNMEGVNCLRQFPGGEPVVFGARTLCKNTLYRYVPVVRLLLRIRKTIKQLTRLAVFQLNETGLRESIAHKLYGFLDGLRRSGALQGDEPEAAFFIQCDERNNTEEDRQNGLLRVRVEVALVRPAEFIEVEVTQQLQPAPR